MILNPTPISVLGLQSTGSTGQNATGKLRSQSQSLWRWPALQGQVDKLNSVLSSRSHPMLAQSGGAMKRGFHC